MYPLLIDPLTIRGKGLTISCTPQARLHPCYSLIKRESTSPPLAFGQACDSFVRVQYAHVTLFDFWVYSLFAGAYGCIVSRLIVWRPPCCEEAQIRKMPVKKKMLSQLQLL